MRKLCSIVLLWYGVSTLFNILAQEQIHTDTLPMRDSLSVSSISVVDDKYVELHKKALDENMRLRADLENLQKRKEELNIEIVDVGEKIHEKRKNKSAKEKEIQQISQHKKYKDFLRLDSILNVTKANTIKLAHDTLKLNRNVLEKDKELQKKLDKYNQILTNQEQFADAIIVDHEQYINQSFLDMTVKELLQIKTECCNFSGAKNMGKFLLHLDAIIFAKQVFDDITNAISSPYNEQHINEVKKKISHVQNLSVLQQEEIAIKELQLSNYKEGIKTFQIVINELDKRRKNIDYYSALDFKDDLPFILTKKISKDVEQYIQSVPYLDNAYNQYMAVITENPMQHPDIEQEILSIIIE